MAIAPGPYQDLYLTVDDLFDFLQRGLDFPAHALSAIFDQQYSYPARIDFDFVLAVADDEGAFGASNLIVVPEPGTSRIVFVALASLVVRRRGITSQRRR
jgi:hypothetical protein